jgi:hypothetical protein
MLTPIRLHARRHATALAVARGELRRDLHRAQHGRCPYCGRPLASTGRQQRRNDPRLCTIDHVVPRARGGTSDLANLVAACRACNAAKGDRLILVDVDGAAPPARPPSARPAPRFGVVGRVELPVSRIEDLPPVPAEPPEGATAEEIAVARRGVARRLEAVQAALGRAGKADRGRDALIAERSHLVSEIARLRERGRRAHARDNPR